MTNEKIDFESMDEPMQQKSLNPNDFSSSGTFEKPDLAGQEFTIKKIELEPTNNDKDGIRSVICKVYYDETTYETYGGVKQFRQRDDSWGAPSVYMKGNSAIVRMIKLWSKAKGKDLNGLSGGDILKLVYNELPGCKVKIVADVEKFDGKTYKKNYIGEFL